MGVRERLFDRFFSDLVESRVQAAVKVIDDKWWDQIAGVAGPQDRQWWDVKLSLDDALEAYRINPLAFRIVSLTSDFVVGRGITLTSDIKGIDDFIGRLWNHPKNHMTTRLYSWCDELSRAGEVFIVLFTNPADGLTYIREIPAVRIDKIETDEDDLEKEIRYHEILKGDIQGRWWPAAPQSAGGPEVLHFAINKPVGCVRGQGDLVAIIPWLRRYKEWLEDRVRINRFKNSFLWKVTVKGALPGDLQSKRTQYATPPEPGSIIVTDENENWEPIQAKIEAEDVEPDGKALRLMIGAGAGVPLHFLAEGETATRATAKEMGGPTVKHYQHRQLFFCELLTRVITRALERAIDLGKIRRPRGADFKISHVVEDMTEEDNLLLAQAAKQMVDALVIAKGQGWVTDDLAMSMFFKAAGAAVDIPSLSEELSPGEEEVVGG